MKNMIIYKRSLAVRKRAFSIWQKTPHKVAPLSEERHTCQSCATEFQGNFCPRCGQAAVVGRYSFKKAFLLFLDIWGLGNRSMFRSIRDLMLRPGYMIQDYIGGCQSAYFPPFKMFFLLAAFSVLLTNGISFEAESEQQTEQTVEDMITETSEKSGGQIELEIKETDSIMARLVKGMAKTISAFEKKYPTFFAFIMLLLISAPLYLFIRHCPSQPDLRYAEHVVALVYTSNMYSCYILLSKFLPFISTPIKAFALFMIIVALSQFTGYRKRRIFLYTMLTLLIIFIILVLVVTALVYYLQGTAGE